MPRFRVPTRLRAESGEVSSWLIMAAGLAAAALVASATLGATVTELASAVGTGQVAVGGGSDPGADAPGGVDPTENPPSLNDPGADAPGGVDPTENPPSLNDPGADAPGGVDPIENPPSLNDPGVDAPGGVDPHDNPETVGDHGPGTAEPGPGAAPGDGPFELSDDTIGDINALIERLPEDGDPRSDQAQQLRDAIDEAIDDPAIADEVFRLTLQGYPIEIAIAMVTGDWSGVEGGNPANYTDDEIATILRALGIEDPNAAGVAELLSELDPGLLALLFHEGREYELSLALGQVGTPGSFLLPANASASLEAGVTISLSNPLIGVGFEQSQTVEISAQVIGRIEGAAGKSTLGKIYKVLSLLDAVPPELQALVDRHPLLKGALKGLPFSVAYSQYAGTELAYHATLNPAQAQALADGDLGALPDIFDPHSFEEGNSVLIQAGAIEGSEFMAKYKLLQINAGMENFDGIGFGVTALGDGKVAIYAGDIEAVESATQIGLPFLQLGATESLEGQSLAYAELDLNTPEGQAAYEAFITGGGLPDGDTNGITTATTEVINYDYDLGVHVDLGPLQVNEILNSQQFSVETTTFSDGSATTTFETNYEDKATQVVAPHGADGNPDLSQAEVTILFADLGPGHAQSIAMGYDDTGGLPDYPDGDGYHAQITFTASELLDLQATAQQAVQNTQPNYDEAIAFVDNFTEALAAADGIEEIIQVVTNNSPSGHFWPVDGLASISAGAAEPGSDDWNVDLPGELIVVPAE